jgi:hypothetical protein
MKREFREIPSRHWPDGANRKLTRNCDPEKKYAPMPLTEKIGWEGGTEIGKARRPANVIFNVLRGVRIDCAIIHCPNLSLRRLGFFIYRGYSEIPYFLGWEI